MTQEAEKESVIKQQEEILLKFSQHSQNDCVGVIDMTDSTKISEKLLDKWAEHADLMRIGGVGPEYSEVLNEIGIDSVKEFAHRNPANTLERIKKLDEEKPDVIRRIPTLEEITKWIEEAKTLPKAI